MRNLNTVIDVIVEVAPELEGYFTSVKTSVRYAAPEAMYLHWNRATEHTRDHPKQDEIAKIFSGQVNV